MRRSSPARHHVDAQPGTGLGEGNAPAREVRYTGQQTMVKL
jgi:hypothetical protein